MCVLASSLTTVLSQLSLITNYLFTDKCSSLLFYSNSLPQLVLWVGGSWISGKFLSPTQRGPLSISRLAFTQSRGWPASSTRTGAFPTEPSIPEFLASLSVTWTRNPAASQQLPLSSPAFSSPLDSSPASLVLQELSCTSCIPSRDSNRT